MRILGVLLVLMLAETADAGVTRVNVNAYDTMVLPEINGTQESIGAHSQTYPSRDQFGQFAIFINTTADTMLMVRATDTDPVYSQDWEIVSNDSTAPCVNAEWCLKITFRSPSDPAVVQTTYTGTEDWRDAADEYKAWVSQQSWYRGHGKIATGQLAYIENCATNAYTYYQSNIQPTTTAFGLLGSKRVGCFMTQYRTSAFDVNYPSYTCSGVANCAAWLQNLKNSVNGFGLPYINGALWDTTHGSYSSSNMCQDSNGSPTVYSGNLRYVDPLLSTWPQTLYDAFAALQATDTSLSEGVYIDVSATVFKTCYYGGGPWVANYAAWITGTKAVLSKFTNQIVMAEGLAEIYLPYVDIAYLSTPNTNASTAIGLFGYIYGDAPGAHIVGYSGSSLSSCTAPAHRARATFSHDAVMFSSGFTCDFLLAKSQHALDLKRYYYGAGTVPAATRSARN